MEIRLGSVLVNG